MRSTLFRLLLVALALSPWNPVLAELRVEQPWMRGVPPGQANSAAYLRLVNDGPDAVRVVGAASPRARAVELHESVQEQGMWRMRPLEHLIVPAGGAAELAPGGAHLMVMGLQSRPAVGDAFPLLLELDNGRRIELRATVRPPGWRPAAGHGH